MLLLRLAAQVVVVDTVATVDSAVAVQYQYIRAMRIGGEDVSADSERLNVDTSELLAALHKQLQWYWPGSDQRTKVGTAKEHGCVLMFHTAQQLQGSVPFLCSRRPAYSGVGVGTAGDDFIQLDVHSIL